MAANRNRIELRAGQVLFREGEAPTTGFLLEQGEIAVSIRIGGEPIVLSRLRAGDILGEMGVFDGAPRSATATALTDCVLLTIDRNQISERLDKADPILRALLEGQVRRYRGAIRAIRETAAQRAGAGPAGSAQRVRPSRARRWRPSPARNSASRRTCARRWRATNSTCASSRSCTSPAAVSPATRRWCAGTTRCAARSRRCTSSAWPRSRN
jgi:CRP-like cAMP-binding protein